MKSLIISGFVSLGTLCTGCGNNSTGLPDSEISPSTVSAELTGEYEVTLNWTKCEDASFNGYTLYRSQTSGIETDQTEAVVLAVLSDATSIEYVDSGIDEEGWIYYALTTTDANGNAVWSNEEHIYISSVPNVDGLTVGPDSHGRDVVLYWNAVPDVDGYKVYFRPTEVEQWVEIIDTTQTSCLDSGAQSAGYYSVKAYQGEDTSHWYSTEASTMPNIINATYIIYDNYCSGDLPDGFIFGELEGEEGNSWDPDFTQDMYAYDNIGNQWNVSFYSGNYGPSGNGNQCFFQESLASGYCEEYGTWIGTEYSLSSSEILFIKLPKSGDENAYAKVYDLCVMPYMTEVGTYVSFRYEYQPQTTGLTLFTTND